MDRGLLILLELLLVMVFVVGLVVIILWYRSHLVKKTRGKILVQIKPAAGKGWQDLCPYTKGEVDIPEDIKHHKAAMHCVVNKTATWTIDYPQNFPAMVQTQVDTVVFREGDTIPLTEDSDRPLIDATRFANLINQKDTSETIRRSGEISSGTEGGKKNIGGLMWVYILLGIIVVAIGTLIYLFATGNAGWIKNVLEGIDLIESGVGVK